MAEKVPQATIEALETVLASEAAEYRRMVALTANEQTALKRGDMVTLNETIRQKQALLPQLNRWAKRREQLTASLAAALHLPADATLTDLLATIGDTVSDTLITLREEFIELMEQLITLNHANKLILQTELARVDSTYRYIASLFSEPEPVYAPNRTGNGTGTRGNILNWEV